MRATLLVFGAVAVLASAGCSGVPSSSRPEFVKSVGGGSPPPLPTSTPEAGADPASIVAGFLAANVNPLDAKHSTARQFLAPEQSAKWDDSTATVVDSYQVGSMNAATRTVPVSVVKIGMLTRQGVYAPVPGSPGGTASEAVTLSFVMKLVNGQWRIQVPGQGLIVRATELASSGSSAYKLRSLYFLDSAGRHLVADPRYTALTGPALAKWLLERLQEGPQQTLSNAVQKLPEQINLKAAEVTERSGVGIELPGSGQLDPDARTRLASQLANTFAQSAQPAPITITDGGRPVTYDKDHLLAAAGTLNNPPAFYILDGSLRQQNGDPVDGPLGLKTYGLTSAALALSPDGSGNFLVAGVTKAGGASTLLVGTLKGGLRKAGIPPGELTRPSWAPDQSEVWVGRGSTLYRVARAARPVAVPINLGPGSAAQIRAVRVSPDGARLVLVLAADQGPASAYVGTVARQGASVRVEALAPITPSNVDLTDIDWNDQTTLYAIGVGPSGYGVWSVQADGAAWTERNRQGLPAAPQTIAAAPGAVAWVSSNGGVFKQDGPNQTWVSPFQPLNATVVGRSPTYLE
ncbi:MAG: GerMN domain-containing protein [Actinomycetota bacterium]